jgi:hypothetical protein
MRMLPILFTLGLAACTSPEATRIQGGGPGGDTGNRPAVVSMHEGSRPFQDTPRLVPGGMAALEAARQATGFGQR